MEALAQIQNPEAVYQSLQVLLLQLLTFAVNRTNNSNAQFNKDYLENGNSTLMDKQILQKVEGSVQQIIHIIDSEIDNLKNGKGQIKQKSSCSDKKLTVEELQAKLNTERERNQEIISNMYQDISKLIKRNQALQDKVDTLMTDKVDLNVIQEDQELDSRNKTNCCEDKPCEDWQVILGNCSCKTSVIVNMQENISLLNQTIRSCETGVETLRSTLQNMITDLAKIQDDLKVVKNNSEVNKNVLDELRSDNYKMKLMLGHSDVSFYIINKKSGLAVTVDASPRVFTSQPAEQPGQIWNFRNKMLYSKLNGLVLSKVPGAANTLTLSEAKLQPDQIWEFMEDGIIISRSYRVLDVTFGNQNPGAEVVAFDKTHWSHNQIFKIEAVHSTS